MKLAFIVLAHRYVNLLARLIHALGEDGDTFFVHLDKRAGESLWTDLQERVRAHADIRAVPRRPCYWGSLGLVRATLEGIGALVSSGIHYDRAILISGQDYPIKSRLQVRTFLAAHPGQEFIESFPMSRPNRWTTFGGPYQAMKRAVHWHAHFRGRWLHLPLRRTFPLGLEPFGGSQWWCLTRTCVEYIHRFVDDHPAYVSYFKHSFIPDEMFFQTIVSNSPLRSRVTGHNLTFVDSSSPTPPWPSTLDRTYLPALMSSPLLFARKFDPHHDPQTLDRLDAILDGRVPLSEPATASADPLAAWAPQTD